MEINTLIVLFFHFRRKAFRASLLSQQWKVLSQEVRFTRKPLDTRSIVRKQTKCHHYVPPEKKMKLMLLSESGWRETCNIRHIRNVEHKKQSDYLVGFKPMSSTIRVSRSIHRFYLSFLQNQMFLEV